jgi:hypothetical protein
VITSNKRLRLYEYLKSRTSDPVWDRTKIADDASKFLGFRVNAGQVKRIEEVLNIPDGRIVRRYTPITKLWEIVKYLDARLSRLERELGVTKEREVQT